VTSIDFDERRRRATAEALTAFGNVLASEGVVQVGDSFTPDSTANRLIETDPNAFLIGVLCTQGVPAERAWAGPHGLLIRLGHLDPRRLAADPVAVAAAVKGPPALHRFVETVPRWISSAGQRLADCYGANAAKIWPSGSHVLDVTDRLLAFDGIGRKKAVMAVGLLSRHLGIELEGACSGSVAYDVHVRRVFLRAGLAESDSPEAIEAAAAWACAEDPGSLDLPTWTIGRQWCRPTAPRCKECPIGATCAGRTQLTPAGVGTRGRREPADQI
jgi:uncharacterized HhH-GPD family protein